VNRLLGEERVVVSEQPARRATRSTRCSSATASATRWSTPRACGGPGRRSETTEHVSALMTVRALERADVALLLIDADEGCTDQDARVGRLTRDRGVAVLVLANKWDRLRGEGRAQKVRDDIAHGLRFMADAPVLAVSAKTGAGLDALFERVRALHETSRREISTSELNRWLQDAVRRHEPAMAQRGSRKRPLKFFYATQTGVRPPAFTLFCSEPGAVQPAYIRFLENRLRDAFDLAGTPVRIRLRARSARRAATR
jgi:GTP-binding protein